MAKHSLSFANKVGFQCANEFHIQILEGINTKLYSTGLTLIL